MLVSSIAVAVVAAAGMSAAYAQVAGDGSLFISPPNDNDALSAAVAFEADSVAAAAAAWAASDAYMRAAASPSVARTVAEYEHTAGDLYAEAAAASMAAAAEWSAADRVYDEHSAVASAYRLELTAAFAYERAATAAVKWSTTADDNDAVDAVAADRSAAAAVLSRERMADALDIMNVLRSSTDFIGDLQRVADLAQSAMRTQLAERAVAAERAAAFVADTGSTEQLQAAERAVAAERAAERAMKESMGLLGVATNQMIMADKMNTELIPAMSSGDWDRARSVFGEISMSASDSVAQMSAAATLLRDAAHEYDLASAEWAAAGDPVQAAEAAEQSVTAATNVDAALANMAVIEQVMTGLDLWFSDLADRSARQ